MAGHRNIYSDREQYLRQTAHAADDMLRQLQDFTLDTTPKKPGRSRGMGCGNRSRGGNPWVRSNPFRGNSRRGSSNIRRKNWQGSTCDHRDSPGHDWPLRGRQFSDYSPGYESTPHLTPHNLVESLACIPTFSASILQLMETMAFHPSFVREVTSAFPEVFHVNGETVELKPQVSICTAHSNPQGCLRHLLCKNLHICPEYVFNWCYVKNCPLGHKWHTDHNISVLKPFFLEHLQIQNLRKLVQHLSELSNPGQLDVCRNYNEGGCSQTDCDALHLCRSYIIGLTRCSQDDCQLNHDLLSEDCSHLLISHGLSINETPRDILVTLLTANPTLAQPEQFSSMREKYLPERLDHHQTSKEGAKKMKQKRLNDIHKEREPKKVVSTRRERNLKEKRKWVSRESESHSFSESDSDDESSLSSDTKDNTRITGISDKGQSKKGKHVWSEDELSLKTKGESESGGSDSEDSVVPETESAKKTSERNRKVKSVKEKYIKSDDDNSSSGSENESDSGKNDYGNAASSDIEESRSKAYIEKKKRSKAKISKQHNVPGLSDQSTPPAPTHITPKKQVNRRTIWSHYLQGDVPVLEICYYSVESMCRYERSACQRLHSSQHFHWQVAEQLSRWFNLRPSQVTCLERSFCDPSQDGVDLPRLDPSTLDISVSGLFILMGRESWYADFKTMNLINSSKTKTLQIRRLCTETISGQVIKPANFIWYFLDKNQKWVQYGKVDTAGEKGLVSNVTPDDIEKHFQQNPSVSMSFQNSKFTYILDFSTMKQTNQKTQVSREVRRRPEPHLPDEKAETTDKTSCKDLPSNWEIMQPEERVRLVSLASSSSEYQTVVGLLQQKVSSSNVIKVERIQNPYLWRALQNKIKEMTTIYGDVSKVDIRQLFHGTKPNVVASICAENFDWRLHGSSTGQAFGRGTYFAADASYSYGYCCADSNMMKYLFVVRTAVGTMTKGGPSMVRPPFNSATNALYDSTVDNLPNPSIIVKYDKQEYYPEYLMTLT